MALARLSPLAIVRAVSPLYETDPVPIEQPPFLNAACAVITGLRPAALLRHLQEVEREIGRRRGERWGPRVIDIDLLLYEDQVVDEPGLSVPHAELPSRAFVLVPLAEIAAGAVHPASGISIRMLSEEIDRSGVRLVEERGWERLAAALR
jgi:2-amino-4-hydroxy-6-hydroxymethyldihydropteridine diphosphokinase